MNWPRRAFCVSASLSGLLVTGLQAGGSAESVAEGYDVIVVAGQSNAVGCGLGNYREDPIYLQEAGRVFQLGRFGQDDGKIIPASEPLQHWDQTPGKNLDRKGFAYPFALRYAQGLPSERKVLLVPVGRGSTTILLWDRQQQGFIHAGMDDAGPPVLWDDMVDRMRKALASHAGSRLVAVLWQQGEADVTAMANPTSPLHGYMTSGALYASKLEELRAQLRTLFDVPGLPPFLFLIGELSDEWRPMKGSAAGRKAKADVNAAMNAAVESDPAGASRLITTAGIVGANPGEDGLHFSAAGSLALAKRYHAAFVALQSAITQERLLSKRPSSGEGDDLKPIERPATGRGSSRLVSESIRQETHLYRRTPQGNLTSHVFYPPDWKKEDRRPVVAFFYGGGWRNGSPAQFLPQAEYFAVRGLVCVVFDYRVLSRHGTGPDASVADARAALRWIRAQADVLGIDPTRVAAVGGSAGAHLVAMTAVNNAVEPGVEDPRISCRPDAQVLFNPPLDLTEMNIRDEAGRAVSWALSPLLHVQSGLPPAVLFYGSTDPFLEQGRRYWQKTREADNSCQLFVAPDAPHGFFNQAPWLVSTTVEVDRFLQRLGYLTGESTLDAMNTGVLSESTSQ